MGMGVRDDGICSLYDLEEGRCIKEKDLRTRGTNGVLSKFETCVVFVFLVMKLFKNFICFGSSAFIFFGMFVSVIISISIKEISVMIESVN